MSEFTEGLSRGIVAAIVAVCAIVLAGAVVVGGWQAGWWFTTQNAHRQGQIRNIQAHSIQSGYAAQSGLLSDFGNKYTEIQGIAVQIQQAPAAQRQALIDQRLAIANQMCADAAQISISIGPANRAWVKKNCSGSAVSAGSSLRKGS